MCGGALRRFLDERNSLPDKPLTAGIPVSVRPKDDEGNGNAITFIVSTLGTDLADVRERLEAIRESVNSAKEHVQSLPRQAMMQYTVLLMAPTILTLLTGIGGRTRPMFNITISNVPARTSRCTSAVPKWWPPTRPPSSPTARHSTLPAKATPGHMNFGYTGCHSSMPSMQRLAVYTADALAELEAVYAQSGAGTPRVPAKKAPRAAKPKLKSPRKTTSKETSHAP
jgi:diacylglycerol O-acyltransferase